MAFVVVPHYRLQIVFLLSQDGPKEFFLFIKDDRRFCQICFQKGLMVYPGGWHEAKCVV